MDWIVPLVSLIAMEIVLGIDNIVFLSILVSALPEEQRKRARAIGLGLALVARLVLLLGIRWVMGLSTAIFHWSSLGFVPEVWVQNHHVDAVTGRDLVLLLGGAFLVGKATTEIHKKMTGNEGEEVAAKAKGASFGGVIAQIIVLDLVFSLDSVISAIGMVQEVWVMYVATLVAVGFMAAFSGKVSKFIEENPTFKMLALAFLVLVGVMLVAEGIGSHVGKGYLYAAMAFSFVVELLNMRMRKKAKVHAPPPAESGS
ncbi:MAG: TerC family protein [Myxococcales bacterium]|nr:TerC family protein [Myxococcales bacterium]